MTSFYSPELGSFTSEKDDLSDLSCPYLRHARQVAVRELIGRAEQYLHHNAAESGADVLIRDLIGTLKLFAL